MGDTETAVLIQLLETRTGFTFPDALRNLYLRLGGTSSEAIRLLSLSDVIFMLDNWPRYGFDPGYLPIAEDDKGDLYCVRCHAPRQGHVFHLRWSGEDLDQFGDVEQFIKAMLTPTDE
jgi:cell wall assembly regulator SMI1